MKEVYSTKGGKGENQCSWMLKEKAEELRKTSDSKREDGLEMKTRGQLL